MFVVDRMLCIASLTVSQPTILRISAPSIWSVPCARDPSTPSPSIPQKTSLWHYERQQPATLPRSVFTRYADAVMSKLNGPSLSKTNVQRRKFCSGRMLSRRPREGVRDAVDGVWDHLSDYRRLQSTRNYTHCIPHAALGPSSASSEWR